MIKNVQLSQLDGTKAYAKLRKQVFKAGILDRDYGFYAFLASIILLGFLISAYFVVMLPISLFFIIFSDSIFFFCSAIGRVNA